MKFHLSFLLLLPGLLLPLHADPQSELAAFSSFSEFNPNDLAGGKILEAKGSIASFPRGVSVQSLMIYEGPISTIQNQLVHWDTSKHKELNVYLQAKLPVDQKVTPDSFVGLSQIPENRSTAFLVNSTLKLGEGSSELQVNTQEAQAWSSFNGNFSDKAVRREAVFKYWAQILAGRVNLYLSHNYVGEEGSYASGSRAINSFQEVKSLLQADRKVFNQFGSTLKQTPFYSSNPTQPSTLYYSCYDIQGQATLATGATYTIPTASGCQIVDMEYYENYGVYGVVELQQLWPITVNGKEETLVWRGDLVSSASVEDLHGTEKMAASMIMMQDVKQSILAFREELK